MRKTLFALGALIALFVGLAAPASAITGNFVRDYEHPFVGLLVMYDEDGEFAGRCSGSLLTADIFLTAGHCTDGAASARVYFQQDAGANYDPALGYDPISGYPDTCAPGTEGFTCSSASQVFNWGFADFAGFPDTLDAGLVILDHPIELDQYAVLPAVGTLDAFATRRGQQDVTVTASGYGLSYSSPVAVESYRERLMANAKITNLRSNNTAGFNVQSTGNGNGRGGTCSGDSGGPIFLGGYESNLVVAVTSFGLNAYCRGTDSAYRVDTAAAQQWIFQTAAAAGADTTAIQVAAG
jgi:hypothetical protein